MWYGEYIHTLDNKDRFILPSKFREKIKALEKKNFYMTRGLEGCLFLFAESVWESLEARLKAVSFTKQEGRSFNRLYFSGAVEIEIDAQGRVTIPGYLKEFAQIKKEVVIVGVADRIELWDSQRWSAYYDSNKQRFEATAENLFE